MENDVQIKPQKASVWKKLGLALLLLIALLIASYTLSGFILLPRLAKDALEDYVLQHLGRELKVQAIEFNPFSFAASLKGVELREADGTLLISLRKLSADLRLQDLMDGKITLSELGLQAPWVDLKIDRMGKLNLAALIEDAGAGGSKNGSESGTKPGLRFLIKQFQIQNGTLKVTDLSGTTTKVAHVVPINLQLNEISNQPGTQAPVKVTAATTDGGALQWEGDLSLQPLSSHGRLQINSVRLLTIWEFLRERLNLDPPHGSLDLDARYSFGMPDAKPGLVVDGLQVQLSGLLLRRDGAAEPVLTLQSIALADGRFDLDGNRLVIGQLRVADGSLNVSRNKRIIDWSDLVRTKAADQRQSDEQQVGGAGLEWSAELQRLSLEKIALTFVDGDLERPVTISVDRADLALSGKARQVGGNLSGGIEEFELKLGDIALARAGLPDPLLVVKEAQLHQGRMDLATQSIVVNEVELKGGRTGVIREKTGRLDWASVWKQKAGLQKTNPEAQQPEKPWRVDIASVRLNKFDVALSDRTNAAAVELHLSPIALQLKGISSAMDKPIGVDLSVSIKEEGLLEVKGELDAAKPAAGLDIDVKALSLLPLRPYLQPVAAIELGSGNLSTRGRLDYGASRKDAIAYHGALRIDNLLVKEPETGETLLGWKQLDASELTFSLNPEGLHLKQVLLTEPAGKFVINKDLSTNWQKIAKTEPEKSATDSAPAEKSLFPVSVERIQVDNGKLDFSDLSLPLDFSSKVHELNGAIVGISTEPGAKASSDLKGRVDEFGSAAIMGEIAPLDPLLFTDMRVEFSNLSMSQLTPYTVKFAGYEIASGKLSLDLHYKINGKKLQAENQIVLDKLTLGKKVESPDAIDAPLELAIALMQDSSGIIDLGLPVRGDLNDPQFSYGHLVFKAIGNLLTKIVTAPFRVLGAILGVKGDNLDAVAFEHGSAILDPPEQEKLKAVVKVLSERPRLALEIKSQYDEKTDGEALRELALRREVGERLGRKPVPGRRPDPISLTDSNTRTVVEELFTVRISADELARLKTAAKPQAGATGNQPAAGSAAAQKDAPSDQTISAAPDLYEQLYRRLVEVQPLATGALKKLANDRGQAIVQEVKKIGKLPDARIRLLEATSVTSSDADKVISRLNLGVGS